MENRKIKTIIADDHSIVVEGLKHILSKDPKVEVVGVAYNGQQAVQLAENVRPELVILDIKMPILDGIQAAQVIRQKIPSCKLIALSGGFTFETFQKAINAGFVGFVDKESDFCELTRAIDEAIAGHIYHCRKVRQLLADSLRQKLAGASPAAKPVLSDSERLLVQLLTEGLSVSQIATRFAKSPKTVDAQKRKLMQRLGVNNLAELTKWAIQNGIVSLESIAC